MLGRSIEASFADRMQRSGIALLPITLAHIARLSILPLYHRDPFDRMLIAQSLTEGIRIISADAAFDAYGVTRLW